VTIFEIDAITYRHGRANFIVQASFSAGMEGVSRPIRARRQRYFISKYWYSMNHAPQSQNGEAKEREVL